MRLKVALLLLIGVIGLSASLWVMWNYNFEVGLGYTVMLTAALVPSLILIRRVG